MQSEPNAKQQIVERIKNSTNILVTVGNDPSVDALSAALSLTLMLNRLDKHATAVFSGQIPPAINFLQPDKMFEDSVDSLRDFIIALDKEKADRLRYKVENDVVRIFITPYKTILSQDDLKFSQGDFNVELIIALGVERREDLDAAITAHGRILHDATVVTINADGGKSTLGSTDWSDASASSLCEMLMSLSEALQSGLLDQQIATAVLTGIVAATDRFRNEHTSPRVMTMAAQLMAAGANQQLIAAKLEEGHELVTTPAPSDGSTKLDDGKSHKVTAEKKKPAAKDGALEIAHAPAADVTPAVDPGADALKEAEAELAESLEQATVPVTPTLSVSDLQKDLEAAVEDVNQAAGEPVAETAPAEPVAPELVSPEPTVDSTPKIIKKDSRSWRADPNITQPAFGGTLNATTSEAEAEHREEEFAAGNRQILSHDAEPVVLTSDQPVSDIDVPSIPAFEQPEIEAAEPEVTVPEAPKPLESTSDEALSFEAAPVPQPTTLADIDSQVRGSDAEDARAAIDAALSAMPFDPAGNPLEGAGAVPALDLNHEQPVVPAPVDNASEPYLPPAAPALPPLPDFSTLPELPVDEPIAPLPPQVPPLDSGAPLQPPQTPPEPTDPGQFKIPGQP